MKETSKRLPRLCQLADNPLFFFLSLQDSFSGLDAYASFPSTSIAAQTSSLPRSSAPSSINRRYSRQIDVPAPLETGELTKHD